MLKVLAESWSKNQNKLKEYLSSQIVTKKDAHTIAVM